MKHIPVLIFLFLSLYATAQRTDTFEVYFALKETKLNKKTIDYLDSLIGKRLLADGKKITLLGYGDYRGSPGRNDTISAERAMAVRRYLSGKHIDSNDIVLAEGKGKIERPGMTSRDGYAPDRKVMIIAKWKASVTNNIDDLEVGEAVVLKNILFYAGRAVIMPESNPELDKLYMFMVRNKTVKIQLEGHICCTPTQRMDEELSENRAKAIRDYLVDLGISSDRINYVGYGFLHPLVQGDWWDESEQRKNRRVEMRVLSR